MSQLIEDNDIERGQENEQYAYPWPIRSSLDRRPPKSPQPGFDSALDQIAYPHLSQEQLSEISTLGARCSFSKGELLVRTGEQRFGCFVLLSGEATVVYLSTCERRVFTRYGAGCFTGDCYLLTKRRSIVTIEAETDIEALRLEAAQIRELMVRKPLLGELFWKAFQRRRELLMNSRFRGLSVLGSGQDRGTLAIAEFLTKNMVPHECIDISNPQDRGCLQNIAADYKDCPVVLQGNEFLFQKPTLPLLAEYLGIRHRIAGAEYDVVILGAGPSGLGAAVHASSEGLSTLVLDAVGPGGQAGASSQIENYAGFPGGVSGSELANLSYLQAMKFGAEFVAPGTVSTIESLSSGNYLVKTVEDDEIIARTIILAVGVSYRDLDIEGLNELYGAGVFHAATHVEAVRCKGGHVHVVGAGNSAGQAAMFLSQHADRVSLIVRSTDICQSMSSYLTDRLQANGKVIIRYGAEMIGIEGTNCISSVSYRNHNGEIMRERSSGLFIFIGAKPRTDLFPSALSRDKNGFVITGPAALNSAEWREGRDPLALETTLPGIFAAGDCRSGTTKRVASAIGDGALAVSCVHQYLSLQSN
jgi:thioredoxin reductase (NADPH)